MAKAEHARIALASGTGKRRMPRPLFPHERFVRVARASRKWLPANSVGKLSLLLVILGLLWRVVWFGLRMPLWGDEAFVAVNLLARDVAGLLRPLEYWQVAPFGFMVAEWTVCRLMGATEWALRLLPFLAGAGALLLFWRFARQVLGRWEALLAVAVYSSSYYAVRHSCEVKPYAVDMLVSLLLMVVGWSLWQNPRTVRGWLALGAVAAIGVWCSFPAAFTGGAVGVLLSLRVLRTGERGPWAGWLAFGLALVGSWALMVALYAAPQAKAAMQSIDTVAWEAAYPPLQKPWKLPWWLIQVHTGYMLAYPVGGSGYSSVLTLLYVVIGSIALARRRPALVWLLLGPLPFNFVAAALHRYPYGTSARIALYMAPSFCLLAGVGLAASLKRVVPARFARAGFFALAGALGLIPLLGMAINLVKPYRSVDDVHHRQAIRRLASESRPGDRWLVYNGLDGLPRWPGMMLSPWLQQEGEVRFYLLQQARVPLQWIGDPLRIESLAKGTGRIWLITHKTGFPNFPDNVLAYMRLVLTMKRGAPRHERIALNAPEQLEVDVFPALLTSARSNPR
ncbi:MAG TPA: glycosyltransferase family 39 protein [Isosphaeraceae bacterium]|nr:glycosyltransferase family 39 protein [Isosphaeraceae bacterium]